MKDNEEFTAGFGLHNAHETLRPRRQGPQLRRRPGRQPASYRGFEMPNVPMNLSNTATDAARPVAPGQPNGPAAATPCRLRHRWVAFALALLLMAILGRPAKRLLAHAAISIAERQFGELPQKRQLVALVGKDASGRRTDLNVILALEPTQRRGVALSVPRDTEWRQPDGQLARVNSAWGRGGPQRMLAALQQVTSLPVHHYVAFSMEEAARCIDSLGGITVDIPQAVKFHTSSEQWAFGAGRNHLTGAQAVQLGRTRKGLADSSDVRGRVPMQQLVCRAILTRLREAGPVALLQAARKIGHVESDLPWRAEAGQPALLPLAWSVRRCQEGGLTFLVIPWHFSDHGRIRVDEEKARIQQRSIEAFLTGGTPDVGAQPTVGRVAEERESSADAGRTQPQMEQPATGGTKEVGGVRWISLPPGTLGYVRIPATATDEMKRKARYLARANGGLPCVTDSGARGIEVYAPAKRKESEL